MGRCFDREGARRWIERNQARYETDGFGYCGVVRRAIGELIGDCGLSRTTVEGVPQVELGWIVARGTGEGVATASPVATGRYDRMKFLPDGRVVDERYVDREHNVSLRTGCFCNPGAGEVAFTISRETLVGGEFGEGMMLDEYVGAIGLPSVGAVSLGLASNYADVHHIMRFAAEFIDLSGVPDDLPPRTTC